MPRVKANRATGRFSLNRATTLDITTDGEGEESVRELSNYSDASSGGLATPSYALHPSPSPAGAYAAFAEVALPPPDDGMRIAGYLQKRRTTAWPHYWQRRYIEIEGKQLTWAKQKDGEVLGRILLNEFHWCSANALTHELSFRAYQANKNRDRLFVFKCHNRAELKEWRDVLQSIMESNQGGLADVGGGTPAVAAAGAVDSPSLLPLMTPLDSPVGSAVRPLPAAPAHSPHSPALTRPPSATPSTPSPARQSLEFPPRSPAPLQYAHIVDAAGAVQLNPFIGSTTPPAATDCLAPRAYQAPPTPCSSPSPSPSQVLAQTAATTTAAAPAVVTPATTAASPTPATSAAAATAMPRPSVPALTAALERQQSLRQAEAMEASPRSPRKPDRQWSAHSRLGSFCLEKSPSLGIVAPAAPPAVAVATAVRTASPAANPASVAEEATREADTERTASTVAAAEMRVEREAAKARVESDAAAAVAVEAVALTRWQGGEDAVAAVVASARAARERAAAARFLATGAHPGKLCTPPRAGAGNARSGPTLEEEVEHVRRVISDARNNIRSHVESLSNTPTCTPTRPRILLPPPSPAPAAICSQPASAGAILLSPDGSPHHPPTNQPSPRTPRSAPSPPAIPPALPKSPSKSPPSSRIMSPPASPSALPPPTNQPSPRTPRSAPSPPAIPMASPKSPSKSPPSAHSMSPPASPFASPRSTPPRLPATVVEPTAEEPASPSTSSQPHQASCTSHITTALDTAVITEAAACPNVSSPTPSSPSPSLPCPAAPENSAAAAVTQSPSMQMAAPQSPDALLRSSTPPSTDQRIALSTPEAEQRNEGGSARGVSKSSTLRRKVTEIVEVVQDVEVPLIKLKGKAPMTRSSSTPAVALEPASLPSLNRLAQHVPSAQELALLELRVVSNNPYSPKVARPQDMLSVQVVATRPVQAPAVFVGGYCCTLQPPTEGFSAEWHAMLSLERMDAPAGPLDATVMLLQDADGNVVTGATLPTEPSVLFLPDQPRVTRLVSRALGEGGAAFATSGDTVVVSAHFNRPVCSVDFLIGGEHCAAYPEGVFPTEGMRLELCATWVASRRLLPPSLPEAGTPGDVEVEVLEGFLDAAGNRGLRAVGPTDAEHPLVQWVTDRTDFEEWIDAESPWTFTPTPTKLSLTASQTLRNDPPDDDPTSTSSTWTPKKLVDEFSATLRTNVGRP